MVLLLWYMCHTTTRVTDGTFFSILSACWPGTCLITHHVVFQCMNTTPATPKNHPWLYNNAFLAERLNLLTRRICERIQISAMLGDSVVCFPLLTSKMHPAAVTWLDQSHKTH